jgi:predicted transcriptional regulator
MSDSPEMRTLLKRATNRELPMGALAALQALRKVLDDLEYEAIVSARSKGATASEIADALGMTRQAVYLRIHRHENASSPGPASGSR